MLLADWARTIFAGLPPVVSHLLLPERAERSETTLVLSICGHLMPG